MPTPPTGSIAGLEKLQPSTVTAANLPLPPSGSSDSSHPHPSNLARRSSFDPPMRLGLGSLPPPMFSQAPPGQRSVPAIDFLHNPVHGSGLGREHSMPNILGSSTGPSTPSIALGNGVIQKEPWNLWSGSPVARDTSDSTGSPQHAPKTGHQGQGDGTDEELASALAASIVLDKSPVNAKRHSAGNMASSWPEEFADAGGIPAQPFALDPAASPSRTTTAANASAGHSTPGSSSPSTSTATSHASTLLPRNVSFSSLLDLPPTGIEQKFGDTATGLARANSLNNNSRRTGGSSPIQSLQNTSSGSAPSLNANRLSLGGHPATDSPTDSISLPSLAYSGSANVSSSGSLASRPASLGNDPASSPERAVVPEGVALYPSATSHAASSNNAAPRYSPSTITHPNNIAGSHNGGAPYRKMDFTYLTDDDGASSFDASGGRSRQPSAAFSDASITSMAFSPLYGAAFAGQPARQNAFDPYSAYAIGQPDVRRDSGYGPSMFSPHQSQMGQNRRPSWQVGNPLNASIAARGAPSFYNPGGAQAGGFPAVGAESTIMPGLNGLQGSLTQINPDHLFRFPTPAPGQPGDFANYGLGMMAPASPYLSMMNGYDRRASVDRSRPVRSRLLEDFRADRTRRWVIHDMQGHIAEFMCDQVGSRYIQEYILENPTTEECDIIYEEVCPVMLQLSVDVFANFCVQRLLEKCTLEQVEAMVMGLKGSVLRLGLQTYGCRVIQKAIEVISPNAQLMILRELEGAVQKCVRDQNANHVVQKIIQTVPADCLGFIVEAFVGHVYTFATHPYSCRVLQRLFENCPDRMTRPLLDELKAYAQNLMQDQYGNYVVQFVIEKGLPADRSEIIAQVHGQVLHLAKHKFASNVIEKVIINANEMELQLLAGEVLAQRVDGSTGVGEMLKHEYANYPLQRLMKHTTGVLHQAIIDQVSARLHQLRNATFPCNAKHLVAVEKLLVDLAPADFPSLMARRYEDHYVTRMR